MKRFLNLYHRLPSPLWPLLASFQAYLLKKRRYGEIYRKALPLIRERMFWEKTKWEEFQKKQLTELLTRTSAKISVYRGNPVPGKDPLGVLKKWPCIEISHFRKNPDAYLDPEYGKKDCMSLFTSGTTGTPKKIVRDPRAEQLNYAYMEARWRNTAGVKLGDRWVIIGGQLVVPIERKRPPFCVAAYPMQQLYASSYHLQPEFALDYMKTIKKWDPAYIYGYASSLYILALFSESTGIRLNLKCVISNAEPLYEHMRVKLRDVFGCSIRDTYGGTEGAFMGFECSEGRMHISPDFGVVEILRDDGNDCAPGEVGKVVVTGLTNRAMPLIRYPNGDSAAWADPDVICQCGCTFPVIERIEGRTDDMIELPNGRFVGRLDPVFKAEFPIREAQIIQKKNLSIEVLIVKEGTSINGEVRKWESKHEIALMKELRARLGFEVPVGIKYVENIPRGPNNKFKAVVRER